MLRRKGQFAYLFWLDDLFFISGRGSQTKHQMGPIECAPIGYGSHHVGHLERCGQKIPLSHGQVYRIARHPEGVPHAGEPHLLPRRVGDKPLGLVYLYAGQFPKAEFVSEFGKQPRVYII